MSESEPAMGPPQTVQELRSALLALRRRTTHRSVGRRGLATLQSMIDAPHQAAVYSISDMAVAAGVNASTLTRLAQRLGYRGFSELQDVFRRYIAGSRDFYSRQANRLLDDDGGGDYPVLRFAEGEISNVETTARSIEPEKIDEAAAALVGARRIRALGLRQCYSAAHLLSYGLGLIRGDVAVMGGPGGTLAEELAALGEGDVLVVISFAPYTREAVGVCEAARNDGARVIAVTDSVDSPPARHAGHVFVVATGGPFFFNAMASTIVLIESLLALVARRLGEGAVSELRRRETLFQQLHTET